MSLLLAGLWPPAPVQQWDSDLLWQPIPYNYVPYENDSLLGFPSWYCPEYAKEYENIVVSDEVINFLKTNKDMIDYINKHSGLNIKTTVEMFELYMGLYAEETAGKVLPEWTKKIYPEFLANVTKFEYKIQTDSNVLVKATGGPLVKKVINDARSKMDGQLNPSGRKLFLYSAHEYNIAYVLSALKMYKLQIPSFASYVVIEFHKIDNVFGFMVYYEDHTGNDPKLMTVDGCEEFFMAHLGTILLVILFSSTLARDDNTLQQVQILFRHGDRTPDLNSRYPKDPHFNDTWYPDGYGALTMMGKMQLFDIGRSLRKRYDDFLGQIYTPEVLDAWSTGTNRTKMSLELVLAGLWPPAPSQMWNKQLLWQPIPYNYVPMSEDKVLRYPLAYCQKYQEEYEKVKNSEVVRDFMKSNINLINHINHHTGLKYKTTWDLLVLYYGLLAQEKTGRTLPEWTKKVYPEFLEIAARMEFLIMTENNEMLKGSGGTFLRKIINDAKSRMEGKLEPNERKFYLYSGHDYNIVFTLAAMKIYEPHLPPYACYIVFEFHKIGRQHGFKIFYQDYSEKEPQLQSIPGCGTFCTLEKFIELMQSVLPDGVTVLAVDLPDETLRQVHVIFRHGDRTPDRVSMYPNDPHLNDTWYPEGMGALTNCGKMQEFNIGKALRAKYDKVLGNIYTPEVLDAFSTDYPRTQMSLQLVLAGLWPPSPSQIWNNMLPWQPIPYSYESILNGKIFRFPLFANCPAYKQEYMNVMNSKEIQDYLVTNAGLIEYINENSGLNCKTPLELYSLYFGLYAEEQTGRQLPHWTKKVYPEFLQTAAILQYQIMTHNDAMLRVAGGPFVKKVIADVRAKIEETLVPKDRKLFLYSGHEFNIANVLAALKIYKPHIPPYASYIVVELHKINNDYGLKIFYRDSSFSEPQLMVIPGCESLCPFDKFVELTEEVIPQSDSVAEEMWSFTVPLLVTLYLSVHTSGPQECDPSYSGKKSVDHSKLDSKYYRNQDVAGSKENERTLKLVHVVFRHGDRTPDDDSTYPLDPHLNHSYYPVGYGQLTNLGKKQEYDIGVSLRKRYNHLLGNIYTPEVVDSWSTDYDRTKNSLQLVLAGLWPPSKDQIWNEKLLWQPIVFNYKSTHEDILLGDASRICPAYMKLFEENLLSDDHLVENAKLKSFYDYVSENTGLNISQPEHVYNLFFTVFAEEKLGLNLPAWTKCVWPDKITEVAVKFYYMYTQTPEMKSFTSGRLLEKMVQDSKDFIENKLKPKGRKLFLYSAHERNVALMLIGLDVFYSHIPPYASYVILELHQINGIYGIKAFYQNYSEDEPILLTIPGCDSFCPFDKFYNLVKPIFPKKSCFENN
ncbi:uncharacterized protein CBL_04681 [Carabus blaptoides fortunei]